jgi:hypothetical protein
MTTSARPSLLSEPHGDVPISERALAYVGTTTKMEFFDLVLRAFEEANISQATLAKRLGKRPEQISRLLGAPGNWTIETAGELLFAIDGSLARIERRWPMRGVSRNAGGSSWTFDVSTSTVGTQGSANRAPLTRTSGEVISVD